MKAVKRGQMYYVKQGKDYMNNSGPGRPEIIISEGSMNKFSDRVMVIYTTTTDKNRKGNVPVDVAGNPSFAICENINTIYKSRLETYIGEVTAEEMANIEREIKKGLGLIRQEETELKELDPVCETCDLHTDWSTMEKRLEKEVQEKNFYKRMCDDLLGKIMSMNR